MKTAEKRGRKPLSDADAKTVGITIRLSPDVFAAIELVRQSEQPDCPLRIFLRERLLRTFHGIRK